MWLYLKLQVSPIRNTPAKDSAAPMDSSEWFIIGLSLGLMPTLHVFGKWMEERRQRMSIEGQLVLLQALLNFMLRK